MRSPELDDEYHCPRCAAPRINPESEVGAEKSEFAASPGEADGGVERAEALGLRFVHRADSAISEGRINGFSSRRLGEAFAELGGLPDDPSAAALFDTFAAGSVAPGFSLIGPPGEPLSIEPLPGDVLCRRGEGGFGHAAIVAGSDFWPRDHVTTAGLNAESNVPGIYVQVVEGGPNPHTSPDCFARRVADDEGWIPHDQMLLRPRRSAFGEGFEESVPVRRDEAYVRWIQESLNQVSGTGLVVDGVLNPQTNGAIRSFQQKRSLVVDGVVGPITERALIDAGAPAPPPLDGQLPAPPAPSGEPRIDPRDERVDVSAKFALQRMLKRSDMRADAVRLIDGINTGRLAGIFGDDLQATVRLARRHGTERWLLVPRGEDAALVLDPAAPMTAPPTVIFRRPTRNTMPGKAIDPKQAKPFRSGREFGVQDPKTGQKIITQDLPPERLDAALLKASRTFELWQTGQLRSCDVPLPDEPMTLGASGDTEVTAATPVANLFPPILCQLRGRPRRRRRPPRVVPPVPTDPWVTTDSTQNVLLHPETPRGQVRTGTVSVRRSEQMLGASHVTVIVGPGATAQGIAQRLLPFFTQAQATPIPSVDEMARAILVFNTNFLPLVGMQSYRDGLCLPVPIEIDSANGDWVLDSNAIRNLAASFPAASQAALTTHPAHLAQPDPTNTSNEVRAFLAARPNALARATRLRPRLVKNPFEAVFFMFELFRQLAAGAFEQANAFLLILLTGELELLASLTAGNAILRRLLMALDVPPPNLTSAQQSLLAHTLGRLRPVVGIGSGLSIVQPRELPETAQQLADRGRSPFQRAQPQDPTGGRHRIVLGRDIHVGRVATETISGRNFTGPAYGGRISPNDFVAANGGLFANDRRNPQFQPRLDIVTAIAPNEGFLDAIRMRDAAILSTGIHQWSAHSDPELSGLLSRFKQQSPDEFALFFGLYNLEVRNNGANNFMLQRVEPNGSLNDMPLTPTPAARLTFFGGTVAGNTTSFTTDWAARVREASIVSLSYCAAQVREAVARFDRIARAVGNIRVQLRGRAPIDMPVNQLITSQLGVAFILDSHINQPGHVRADLRAAANDVGPQGDIAALDERITDRYATIRRTFDTASRNRVIRAAERRGVLSPNHGSFAGW